jgi:hypothetical protein
MSSYYGSSGELELDGERSFGAAFGSAGDAGCSHLHGGSRNARDHYSRSRKW